MPKKKGKKEANRSDFTINDCANALKPVSRVKKSSTTESVPEKSWEDLQDEEFDITEDLNAEGTKIIAYKRKKNCLNETVNVQESPGIVYPEIVWYLLSPYINPENIGKFAGINHATYAITKRESFWRSLYKRYCQNHSKLPERLCIDNNYQLYGLRQKVIRSLYHTHDFFIQRVLKQATQDSCPHELVKRRCANVWYCKGPAYWSVYFKLKKVKPVRDKSNHNFIEELGRIDANPEEDSKVLQVTCHSFHEVPPLMGMTLSSVSVVLSQGFRHHRVHLGFNTGHYNISRNVIPECSVVIDTVVNILVYDWWHPKYPHFENRLPSSMLDEEALPVLKRDFFTFSIESGDL